MWECHHHFFSFAAGKLNLHAEEKTKARAVDCESRELKKGVLLRHMLIQYMYSTIYCVHTLSSARLREECAKLLLLRTLGTFNSPACSVHSLCSGHMYTQCVKCSAGNGEVIMIIMHTVMMCLTEERRIWECSWERRATWKHQHPSHTEGSTLLLSLVLASKLKEESDRRRRNKCTRGGGGESRFQAFTSVLLFESIQPTIHFSANCGFKQINLKFITSAQGKGKGRVLSVIYPKSFTCLLLILECQQTQKHEENFYH